jgi:glycosyltransferase involved in cell wall biosynthesis
VLFLGRLVPEKGLHNALKATELSQKKLVVSVNLPEEFGMNLYYDGLKKDLENDRTTVLPVVNKEKRLALYGQAEALLFPIEWEEPFGIVLIEAMACGTPVIAFNRGSVPEIIRDGVTGFIIDPDGIDRPGKGSWIIKNQGISGLAEAIGRIGELSRMSCRYHVEEKFSKKNMVRGYEQVYANLIRRK